VHIRDGEAVTTRDTHLRLVGPANVAGEDDTAVDGALDIDALFRDLAPYVAAVGLRLLGRRDEVEDLVQDVFLAAHRARRKLRVRHEAKRWLTVVAVRQARRRLRVRRLRAWLQLDDHEPEDLITAGASPEDSALVAQVYGILDRLPVEERLAWTLRHVQGEELAAVAELIGCSLATTKRRIAAAQAAITGELAT
jgi:RNA polymerase sigma-70 factor, ECF subfamily